MTKEQEEALQKIREIAIEDTKVSRELGIKFSFIGRYYQVPR